MNLRPGRRSSLALSLALGLLLPASPTAFAADGGAASGFVGVLPSDTWTADGQTEAIFHLLMLDPSGKPVSDAKLKVNANGASVGAVDELGGGLYSVRITPNAVDVPSKLSVTIKGKTDANGAIDLTHIFAVEPANRGKITLSASESSLVLGQDLQTSLSIALPASSGAIATTEDLLIRVSSGEISDLTSLGGGRFSATYTAPALNYPHLSLITVADRRFPGEVYGTTVIRLQGRVDYPVMAAAGSSVTLRVSGHEYGPVIADASGQARVPIIVPPGISAATQIVTNGGARSETMIDLQVPPTKRLSFFEAPPTVPSDPRISIPLRLIVYRPDGSPDTSANIALSTTIGSLTTPSHLGEGVYQALFTPPAGRVSMDATIQATLSDGAGQSDAVMLRLVPALPASMSLTSEPTTLSPTGNALTVFASVRAADGSGLNDRRLDVSALGATTRGEAKDLGNGDYRVELRADGGTDVEVRALALVTPSQNALNRVVLLPVTDAIAPSGSTEVLVLTTDTYGYPVPHMPVSLSAKGASASIDASTTTDDRGIASVVLQAGAASGLISIEATSAGVGGTAGVLIADPQSAPSLPSSGDPTDRNLRDRWRHSLGTILVDREGAGAPAPLVGKTPPAPVAPSNGVIATSLATSALPTSVAPGATTVLTVSATGAGGLPADGAKIEFFTADGSSVGAVEALGGGQYRATLTAAAGAKGTVRVNVVADGGRAVSILEIPVGSAPAVDVWGGQAGEGTVVASPVAASEPAKEKTERTPAEAGEHPWLRLRVSGTVSSYAYAQNPSAAPGPIYPSALGWGFDLKGAATPFGIDTSLRVVVPKLPYLAIQGGFRWSRYAVASQRFTEPAKDSLYLGRLDVIGRYPIAVGHGHEVGIGARIGYRYDDIITFQVAKEDARQVHYASIGNHGIDVGLEVNAEIGPVYLLAAGSAGIARGNTPHAGNFDFNVGYQVNRYFFVDLGFAYMYRKATVFGDASGLERGTLRDQQITGMAGVGFSY